MLPYDKISDRDTQRTMTKRPNEWLSLEALAADLQNVGRRFYAGIGVGAMHMVLARNRLGIPEKIFH